MNDTVKILGMTFRKMKDIDYQGYSSADAGSYIFDTYEETVIWSPTTGKIVCINIDGSETELTAA